jgi:hypothetical protein
MARAKRIRDTNAESLLMRALEAHPEGLTKTEIAQTEVFKGNVRIEQLNPLISRLIATGAIESAHAQRIVKRTVKIFRLPKPK